MTWWRREWEDVRAVERGIAEVRGLGLNPTGLRCRECGRAWPGTSMKGEAGWLVAVGFFLLWCFG